LPFALTDSLTDPKMLARTRLFACAFLLITGVALPTRAETVMQVYLRDAADAEPIQRYVVLCARKSEPWGTGHSYVVWVTHDLRTNRTEAKGYGFYPGEQRVLVKLAGGKGKVIDESQNQASIKAGLLTHRLIFQVDAARFDRSWAAKESWEASTPNYNLLGKNCTHFTHRVGTSLGLAPPKPTIGERPPFYFERLMQFCRELP